MEDKLIVMTSKQIDEAFPIDKELFHRLKAMQDADIEPFIDEDSPELPDLPEKQPGIFENLFNRLRRRTKTKTAAC